MLLINGLAVEPRTLNTSTIKLTLAKVIVYRDDVRLPFSHPPP